MAVLRPPNFCGTDFVAVTNSIAETSVGEDSVKIRRPVAEQSRQKKTRSPATAGKANRSLLFLEHRIPMPELFTELRSQFYESSGRRKYGCPY